jgi:DNA repair exonuclease SbcCD ATPase subunit
MIQSIAMATDQTKCLNCQNKEDTYKCPGCSQDFCFKHLTKHRQTLSQEFDKIENDHDSFLQTFIQHKEDLTKYPLIKQIDEWEEDSINKIKETAEEYRQFLINNKNKYIILIENRLSDLTEKLKRTRQEDEFNEKHLNKFESKLKKLEEELHKLSNASIEKKSTSIINQISIIPFGKHKIGKVY